MIGFLLFYDDVRCCYIAESDIGPNKRRSLMMKPAPDERIQQVIALDFSMLLVARRRQIAFGRPQDPYTKRQ